MFLSPVLSHTRCNHRKGASAIVAGREGQAETTASHCLQHKHFWDWHAPAVWTLIIQKGSLPKKRSGTGQKRQPGKADLRLPWWGSVTSHQPSCEPTLSWVFVVNKDSVWIWRSVIAKSHLLVPVSLTRTQQRKESSAQRQLITESTDQNSVQNSVTGHRRCSKHWGACFMCLLPEKN